MIDPVQIVLLIVIVVLTILLVILGIQVFLILRDLRKTVRRATDVLENIESITEDVEEPLSIISTFISGLKSNTLFTVLNFVKGFVVKDKSKKDRD